MTTDSPVPVPTYALLDGPTAQEIQDIVVLAARICGAPTAMVTVVHDGMQYFKARHGLEIEELSADVGFCPTVVGTGAPLLVPDTRADPKFRDDDATRMGVGFYAGVPLVSSDGVPFGALCVLGEEAREIGPEVEASLAALARQVMVNLELRAALLRERGREASLLRLTLDLERQVEDRTRERDRIWELSRVPFLILGRDGTWLNANPVWKDVLGWEVAELVGRTGDWLVHPDDEATVREDVESVFRENGFRNDYEMRLRAKDGAYRWLSWTSVADGGLLYCVAVDVTERKALVESEATLQEQLRQSQKMEAVGQLTGGLAHDFNNLLTGITGSLELLAARVAQGRTSEVGRYVDAAQGSVARAASLTHRLLAFSRRQTLEPKRTDVARLVEGMRDLVVRTVGPAIAFEARTDAAASDVLVDRGQLENALLNLCINARDAMPDGGRILVTVRDEVVATGWNGLPPGNYVVLGVSDEGTGMPPEIVSRIFDPFFTTKPLGMGTGLGLSMTYGFARQSGGDVRVRSQVGTGSTVEIVLPRHVGPGTEDAVRPDDVERVPARAGKTVMVVDDEPTIRMLLADLLADSGYFGLEAEDGTSAMAILESDAVVDLLVTDVGLPGGMNGRQVADAARRLRPGLRVIFITGYAESAILGDGVLDEGMHVMTKPFSMEAVAARIAGLMSDA